MGEIRRCAVIGCFPWRFAWGFDEEDCGCRELKLELAQQIMVLRQAGVLRFSVVCDSGVGLYAAEIVNDLRRHDSNLMLFCVTPHEEWATKWPPYLRERYFSVLEQCSCMVTACQTLSEEALPTAYRQIIDPSDMILAVWRETEHDGSAESATIEYAKEKEKPILFIDPDTRKITTYIHA